MKGMKISFFGSSLVSAYWNGAATYYRGIIRALAKRGHQVSFYEPDAYDRQKNRDFDDPPWSEVVVYEPTVAAVSRALDQARNSDLLIKTSGVGVFDELIEAAILEIHAPHTMTAFWDVDAPATLDRVIQNRDDPFRSHVPRYDQILTYGGGGRVVEAYLKLGARSCVPIYNALDPETHFPVAPETRFDSDLGLLANRLPDREARIEEFFFHAAKAAPRSSFVLGGNGWAGHGVPGNVKCIGHVFTRDHNAFNCSARAVLNVSRESMVSYGFSPATRVFEAAGAAACLISDAWEGIEFFLEPDREVLVAKSGDEVAAILNSLSAEEARRIGQAAHRRVLAEHTYERRVDQLEEALGIQKCAPSKHLVSEVQVEESTSAVPR